MQILFVLIFCIVICPIYSLKCEKRESNKDIIQELEQVQCGGIHNTSTGGFAHKPFEQIVENERCAWIIAVTGAVGYTVDIQFLGYPTNEPGSGQELVITGVGNGGGSKPNFVTYLPTSTGFFTVTDANIVIVTFHSQFRNGNSSTGFALRYEDIQNGNISKTSPLSNHHIFESPTFDFKYPQHGGNYASLELTAFLFPTLRNIYTERPKHLLYVYSGLDYCSYDYLYVYTFKASSPDGSVKWQESGRICFGVESQYIPFDDMVLIIFKTNQNLEYSGFWFSLMGC